MLVLPFELPGVLGAFDFRQEMVEIVQIGRSIRGPLNQRTDLWFSDGFGGFRSAILPGNGRCLADFVPPCCGLLVGGPEKALGKVVTVGVASPAQYVLPQSSYVTSSWDQVINGLRVVKNVLPANASIDAEVEALFPPPKEQG